MNVELSERARKRVEELVEEGTYPTAEAVVEAALEQLEHPDFAGVDMAELDRRAQDARIRGSATLADDGYISEMRSKANSIIDAKRRA